MTKFEPSSVPGSFDTSSAMIANRIRADIADGFLEPGSRIRIADLAKRYGTSHLPVREAIRTVEGDRLVESVPHKGTIVRQIDANFIRNLWGVRTQIEAYLVHEAVENLTSDHLAKIIDFKNDYNKAAKAYDVRAMVEINGRLHDAMYEPADNPEAMRMLKSGWELVVALRSRFPYTPERIDEICDQHEMIVEMIRRRNGAAAALLVRQHCESAAASLMEQVKYPA